MPARRVLRLHVGESSINLNHGEGLRGVEDVLKPPVSLLATDHSKSVVLSTSNYMFLE